MKTKRPVAFRVVGKPKKAATVAKEYKFDQKQLREIDFILSEVLDLSGKILERNYQVKPTKKRKPQTKAKVASHPKATKGRRKP